MSGRRETTKCPVACNYCRLKKAKCGGTHPCGTCVDHNEVCVYPDRQQRPRKRKEREREMEDRLARMEVLLRTVSQHTQSQNPVQSPAVSHGETDAAVLPRSPFISQNGAGAASRRQVADTELERLQSPRDLQRASSPGPSISTVVHVASGSPKAAITAACPNSTAFTSSPSRGHGAAADSPGFRSLLTLTSEDLELPSSVSQRPEIASPSFSRGAIATSAQAGAYTTPALVTIADAPTEGPGCSDVAGRDDSWARDRTNVAVEQPMTPPSLAAAEENHPKSLGLNADAPCDEEAGADLDDSGDSSYHISICSPHGIEWVSHQIGKPGFGATARRLSKDIRRNERLEKLFDPMRSREPDMETALSLIAAYFDSCIDSVFGVLDRDELEQRLRLHFENDMQQSSSIDKAWYALRNTVYALGCRVALSLESGPAGYAESRSQSWRYFENALAVATDLMYGRAEVTSVRALILMAFYAEALGSPALEYMLVSNATRLAQSMGLYLGTRESSKLSPKETLSRQWLWWVLYAYEKHVAFRSGRPSAIDDDYVNCPVPETTGFGSASNCDFIRATVKHAQISSAISKQLLSAKARQEPAEITVANVRALDERLKNWQKSLPHRFSTQAPFRNSAQASGTSVYHDLFLHFSYQSSIIGIHGVFCYPWNKPELQSCKSPQVASQIQKSTEAVAEASRQIIIAVQGLQITSAMPLWLTFFFPLVGLINLFVYVLKDPSAPSAASDLSLMDVVVGHFGYLQFISSSELVFPFPREISSYARHLVKRAAKERETSSGRNAHHCHYHHQQQQQQGPTQTDVRGQDVLQPPRSALPPELSSFEGNPIPNLDLREDWYGALLPSFPQYGPLGSNSNLMDDDMNLFISGDMQ